MQILSQQQSDLPDQYLQLQPRQFTLTVRCSARRAFCYFQKIENYPVFMRWIDSVVSIGSQQLRCTGRPHKEQPDPEEWTAFLQFNAAEKRVTWQTLDAKVNLVAAVQFLEQDNAKHPGTSCRMIGMVLVPTAEKNSERLYVESEFQEDLKSFRRAVKEDRLSLPDEIEKIEEDNLQYQFENLVQRWHHETDHLSSVTAKISNPAYLEIINMGSDIIPLILHELESQPAEWFHALVSLHGHDEAPNAQTFTQAKDAWLNWGEKQGYLAP